MPTDETAEIVPEGATILTFPGRQRDAARPRPAAAGSPRPRLPVARSGEPKTEAPSLQVAEVLGTGAPSTQRHGASGTVTPGATSPGSGQTAARARLATALADLEFALAEQRAAVASFRSATSQLGESVRNLGAGLEGYRDRLASIRTDLERTRERARDLAELAAKLEAQGRKA